MKECWSKNPVIVTSFILKVVSFLPLQRNKTVSAFSNNAEYNPQTHPHPKLNCPILEKLNSLFQRSLTPGRDVTIDENVPLFKRLYWMQCIPLKHACFWNKSYMLCARVFM